MRKHALRRSLLSLAATALVVTGIAVPAGPALAAGTGTVTGHLTDAAGQPLNGAYVSVQTSDFGLPHTTHTDATGAYTVSGLDAGEYVVSFSPFGTAFTQYAHQKLTPGAADRFAVAAGATVVVDDQALPTGRITGSLRKRDGSPAQASIIVYTAVDQNYVGSGHTDPDNGTFSLEVLPGSYKLNFSLYPSVAQWNGAVLSYAEAAPITVVAGQSTALQETLVATGSIAGRLTNADGSPAAGVAVGTSYRDFSVAGKNATTGADGRYRIDDVPVSDKWILGFTGANNIVQYTPGKLLRDEAASVPVVADQVATVDEQFLPTGTLHIKAHDAATGAPLSGFCAWDRVVFSLGGCADGPELVLHDVFAGAWGFDVTINDRAHFNADNARVTVAGGPDTTLDVALRPGAVLSVPMTKRAGGAAAEGCVRVAKAGDLFPPPNFIGCSDESTPGTAVAGPLEPGTYQIYADPNDDALGAQWVGATGGTGDRGAARTITLAAGQAITAPAVQFDAAGSIRGTVTDLATGAPVPYACVSVVAQYPDHSGDGCRQATTAENGTYTIGGLGPYAWPVQFARWDYQWRWSGNQVSRPEATTVTVKVGKSVAANIKLRTGGGTIAGTMSDAAGHPVEGEVVPYNSVTGEAAGNGGQTMDAGGHYTAPFLAPQQSVKLRWYTGDGRSGWVGGGDFASATAYQVKNNKTVTVNVTVA
ncbi:carboxypeptidase regulatory-like domain-containing protein [Dactylosporangium sp. CS-033363]|uniref:carboxypeptidase-like regulatory domain-containing protein n=1 Tax=Dactylosporangium sp. CS-033363 TaxID=3239935 RepID=UPI003D8FDBD9